MTKRVFSSTGVTSKGPALTDCNFIASLNSFDTIVSGSSSSNGTTQDLATSTYTSATVDHGKTLSLSVLVSGSLQGLTYESLDTDIATVDQSGNIARVSNGTARILLKTKNLTRLVNASVLRELGVTITIVVGWDSSSLAYNCSNAVDSRIFSKVPETALNIFSSGSVRNNSCWCSDLDLTCIPVGGFGTLISPRHVISAEHFRAGGTKTFVKMDGTVVTRTITSNMDVGPSNGSDDYATDLNIGILDSDVPSGINFAKVMPASYISSYLPNLSKRIPAMRVNQTSQATVLDFVAEDGTIKFNQFNYPTDVTRQEFYSAVIGGDSGHPTFLIVNNGLAIINTTTYGDASGPAIADNISAINSVMTSLGGGYQLTHVDLSGFPSY